jgi:hypothetical protein
VLTRQLTPGDAGTMKTISQRAHLPRPARPLVLGATPLLPWIYQVTHARSVDMLELPGPSRTSVVAETVDLAEAGRRQPRRSRRRGARAAPNVEIQGFDRALVRSVHLRRRCDPKPGDASHARPDQVTRDAWARRAANSRTAAAAASPVFPA